MLDLPGAVRYMEQMLVRSLLMAVLLGAASAGAQRAHAQPLLRTADGIWQAHNRASVDLELHVARDGMPAGESVVAGGEIPYLPAALEQKRKNFAERLTEDPFRKCFLPGVPRIMYLEYPFQIFQTPE